MRDDLQGLDISHDQLKNATNLPVNNKLIIITNIIQQFIRKSTKKSSTNRKTDCNFCGIDYFRLYLPIFSKNTILDINHICFMGMWNNTNSIIFTMERKK